MLQLMRDLIRPSTNYTVLHDMVTVLTSAFMTSLEIMLDPCAPDTAGLLAGCSWVRALGDVFLRDLVLKQAFEGDCGM